MAIIATTAATVCAVNGTTAKVETGDITRNTSKVYYTVDGKLVEHTVVTNSKGEIILDKMSSVNNSSED
jgi:hypothetical protein